MEKRVVFKISGKFLWCNQSFGREGGGGRENQAGLLVKYTAHPPWCQLSAYSILLTHTYTYRYFTQMSQL